MISSAVCGVTAGGAGMSILDGQVVDEPSSLVDLTQSSSKSEGSDLSVRTAVTCRVLWRSCITCSKLGVARRCAGRPEQRRCQRRPPLIGCASPGVGSMTRVPQPVPSILGILEQVCLPLWHHPKVRREQQ